MKLIIDVTKDPQYIQFDGNEIELVNIPADCKWQIEQLRDDRDEAFKQLTALRAAPPVAGVSVATALDLKASLELVGSLIPTTYAGGAR